MREELDQFSLALTARAGQHKCRRVGAVEESGELAAGKTMLSPAATRSAIGELSCIAKSAAHPVLGAMVEVTILTRSTTFPFIVL